MSINASLIWKGFDQQAIIAQLERNQIAALQASVPLIESTLLTTVGTQYYSLLQLRKLGYPYKVGGRPPMPPGVINKQSGQFFRSIRVVGPTKIGSLIVIQVYSVDEDRAWQLAGTPREIPRPYKALLQSRLRQQAARQVASISQSLIKVKVAA